MKAHGLIRALRQILPDAAIAIIHERPWHSLTFSGIQLCLSVTFCDTYADYAAQFAGQLPELVFDLDRQLVADIAVIETASLTGKCRLLIDALILDD